VVVGGALDTYKKAVSFRAAKTIFKRTRLTGYFDKTFHVL